MTHVQIKDLARTRVRYTGEAYQQAQSFVAAAAPAGETLLPDAHSVHQAAVESAIMNRLLVSSRSSAAGNPSALPVQAVKPLSTALRVTVPIDAVERFASMLCGPDPSPSSRVEEALMLASTNGVVTVTLSDQSDAQVHLRCSWDRLRAVLRTAPGVEVLSGSRLQVFGRAQLTDPRPAHRDALSACLRRVMLFSDPRALSWLVDWNQWVVSERLRGCPKPPDAVLREFTRSRFGPTNSAATALLLGGLYTGSVGELSRRPSGSRHVSDLNVAMIGGDVQLSDSLDGAFTGATFRASAAELQHLVAKGSLPDVADGSTRTASDPAAGAVRGVMRRVAALAADLVQAGLGAVSMIIGFQLPLTSKRVDVVLAGLHPDTGDDSYMVIELKSWTNAQAFQDSDSLVTVKRTGGVRLHPGVQVKSYCEYLSDVLGMLGNRGVRISGAAYLGNAVDQNVRDLFASDATDQSRVFTRQRRRQFLDFLRDHLGPNPGVAAADRLMGRTDGPSRNLLARARLELEGDSQFRLLGEQRMAYEMVLSAVKRAHTARRKTVVVVSGGPGSGKSTVGLVVLGELARQGRSVVHATGSRSFTQTLRRYVGRGNLQVQGMFRYFNSFMDANHNGFDVLVCDEAHRIRATSANRYSPEIQRNHARPQIDELIEAARVPVFLLDEDQVVKPGELGSMTLIARYARQRDLAIEVVSLHDQFRCGGSSTYEQWISALLGNAGGEPVHWLGDGRFDLRMVDSPEEMEEFLVDKHAAGETARISAGYCWSWSSPLPDGSLVPDVQIGRWTRPWNVKSDRSVGDAPGSAFWATDPNGFGQVGSVYTAQGFEYDWSGVIIGPDLVARDGRLVTRRAESKDPAFRSSRAMSDEAADRLIRNTYRVLMTRGMRGTLLYSTDSETRAFLASRMKAGDG